MSWTHNADKKISFTPGEGISFMLASDVALYKDIQVVRFCIYLLLPEKVDANGTRTCMANASMASHNFGSHKDCPFAPTAPVVEAFAASNQVLQLIW